MPPIKRREVSEWIKQVAASYGKKVGDIAYIFCSDERILEVICLSAWTPYKPMPNNLQTMTIIVNYTVLSFMASCTFAA